MAKLNALIIIAVKNQSDAPQFLQNFASSSFRQLHDLHLTFITSLAPGFVILSIASILLMTSFIIFPLASLKGFRSSLASSGSSLSPEPATPLAPINMLLFFL